MPLILAIEPDRRQAGQLSAVVRRRVRAELILVDTTEQALDAIGNRMPDLVLVPALLSPQDDAALAAALRVIAAAARVQMLTIPVLGTPQPAVRSGGVLSALRRSRSRSAEPDGCDPSVFAEQIASYLERTAQERASAAADVVHDEIAASAEIATLEEVAIAEPVPEPIAHVAEPVMYAAEPIDDVAEPVAYLPEPVAYVAEAVEGPGDIDQVAEALEHQAEPVMYAAEPIDYLAAFVAEGAEGPGDIDQVTDVLEHQAEPIEYVAEHFEYVAERFEQAVEAVEHPIELVEQVAEPAGDIAAAFEHASIEDIPEPFQAAVATEGGVGDTVSYVVEDVVEPLAATDDDSVSIALQEAVFAFFASSASAPAPAPRVEPPSESSVEQLMAVDEFVAVLEMPLAVPEVIEPIDAIEAIEEIDAIAGNDWMPAIIEAFEVEAPQIETLETEALEIDVPEMAPVEMPERLIDEPERVIAAIGTDPAAPAKERNDSASLESERWAALRTFRVQTWPGLEGLPAESAHVPVAAVVQPEPLPPAAKSEREWVALIESLRHDVERLRTERSAKPGRRAPAPTAHFARADSKGKPVQDEWGFFDPEQCGFAALLAKLEEVTESDEVSRI
jgi:hypothetical protein